MHRIPRQLAGRLLALILLALPVLAADAAMSQGSPPYLQLVETRPEPANGRWITVSDGFIDQQDPGFATQHTWTSPPASMDASGFDLTVSATLQSAESLTGGTAFSTDAFAWEGERGIYFTAPPGGGSQTRTIHLTPNASLADGQFVELWVGASYGPGVFYKYRVSNTPPAPGGVGQQKPLQVPHGALAASLDCPPTIVISALPSLNCHINITAYRRDTADPVEVSLPQALDTFGNHRNGIQVVGAGQQDVSNWDQTYSWGLFVFACPGQQGAAVNCYDSKTSVGPQSVDIIVRQGADTVPLKLAINATGSSSGKNMLAGQTLRIGNVWRISEFINLEENGTITSRPVPAAWLSAQWEFQEVAGTEYVRFRNMWKPEIFLHMGNGSVEAGAVDPGAESAHWAPEWVVGTNLFRIRNRASGLYLNTETGQLAASAIQEDWPSAKWWVLP